MLRWIESFDAAIDDVRMARFYETYTGNQLDNSTAGMHFGVAASQNNTLIRTNPLVSPEENSWVIGFAFRPTALDGIDNGGPAYPYVALRNDDGEQIRLELFTDNPVNTKPGGVYYRLRIMRGATEVARTIQAFNIATAVSDDGWVYFEWKVTIDNATGSFELRYHQRSGHLGVQTATWDNAASGVDTQNQVSTGANRFELAFMTGNVNRNVAFDDIYVLDSTGGINDDYLGRCAIVVQKPASPAEGDTNEWELAGGAANLNAAWDETNTGGNDDSRNTSKVTGQITLAKVDPVPFLLTTEIFGVGQRLICKMETSGSLTLHHRWRKTTGTPAETDGTSFVVSSTTWIGHLGIQDDDPNTALPWVRADLDAYQHGVRNGG